MDIRKYKIMDTDFDAMSLEMDQNVLFDSTANIDNKNRNAPSTQSAVVIKGGWMEKITNKVIDIIKKDFYKKDDVYFTMTNWIYIVDKKSIEGIRFHNHLSMQGLKTTGEWTWVYYVTMPDKLEGDDGVIYFRDKELSLDNQLSILPKQGELYIFPAGIWHLPKVSPKSDEKRRVLAGTLSEVTYRKYFSSYKSKTSLL